MSEPLQLGSFEVDDRIGVGGMGEVYRGAHRETGVPVAVKVIRQSVAGGAIDFHEEVQAHARLLHPGIVYLFDYGRIGGGASRLTDELTEGSPYVAMELADRGTLREAMPITSWEPLSAWLVQILDALAFAHARGVVHRDLKPENFLLFDGDDGPGRVKLADFGIAHSFEREREVSGEKLSETAGTPYYMSPEQLRGEWRRYGPWTDLYALGCIVWRMVSRRPPFEGDSVLAIAYKHENADRPPLEPQFPVPEGLEAWVHRAMAVDPDRRFRRAADAARALPGEFATSDADESAPDGGPSGEGAPDGGDSLETIAGSRTVTLAPTLASDEQPGVAEADTLASGVIDGAPETGSAGVPDRETPSEIAESRTLESGVVDEAPDAGDPDASDPDASVPLDDATPPLPDDWRPEATDPVPAPLVGAGLGLFGLREPPFVDRTESCDRIWAALERVVDRDAHEVAFVRGEAGTGKTRLAEWMTRRIHELGAARIMRAVHTPSGGPHEGLRGALERRLRTLKMPRGEVHAHLLDHLPALADEKPERRERDARALTEYLRPTDDDAEEVDGPRYRFSSAGQRRGLLARVLRRLAARRPLVLWIDDLQWGPEAIALLEYLRDHPDASPRMLVLATLRSDLLADRPDLRERLEAIEGTDHARATHIEPLSRRHQRELLEGLLPLEDDLAAHLAERTEGHPLFAMQLLGHWIDCGDIEVGPAGFRVPAGREVELPGDIHELWMERIERLLATYPGRRADAVLEALEVGAALGRDVDREEWLRLLEEVDLAEPARLIGRLVERGLAERTSAGWTFAHGLLVDSLGRRARRAGRWQTHHRRCARMLRSTITGDERGPRERMAEHFVEAGEPERALEPLLEEVQLAGQRCEDDEVGRLLERRAELLDALEIPDDDVRRLEQWIESASRLESDGEPKGARALLTNVWETLEDDQHAIRAKTADQLTFVETTLGNHGEAREWGERTLDASREAGLERLRGRAHQRLGWLDFFAGELEMAETHAERARQLVDRAGDEYGRVEALRLRGTVWKAQDDERTGELFERIHREATEAGYVAVAAQAVNGLGHQARYAGRLEEARSYYRRYLQKIRELSRPASEPIARMNLAITELQAGRLEAACDEIRATERVLDEVEARERWADLLELMHLAVACATGDEEAVRRHAEPLEEGWPEEWQVTRDHLSLLEIAADYAAEAGRDARAGELRRIASEIRESLNQ